MVAIAISQIRRNRMGIAALNPSYEPEARRIAVGFWSFSPEAKNFCLRRAWSYAASYLCCAQGRSGAVVVGERVAVFGLSWIPLS